MKMKYLVLLVALVYLSKRVCDCDAQTLQDPVAPDVSVANQQQAVLTCTVQYTGTVPPNITITKDVGGPSSIMTSTTDGMTTLTIPAAQLSDSGQYICNATLGNEERSTTFSFAVRDELFISIPQDQLNVTLGSTATVLCNPSQGMVTWEKNGIPLRSELDTRITIDENLTIQNITFADIGVYTCLVAVGNREYNVSATLSIQGYVPPYVPGTVGYGSVSTSDQQLVQCPVEGYPGPVIVYWQTGEGQNVSNTTTVSSGPFVNANGELDLSRTGTVDSGFYRCFAVDIAGRSASQLFLVEVVRAEGIPLGREWYFILLYCVVGAVLVGTVVLLLWFAFSVRDACCTKVSKVIRVRKNHKRTVQKHRLGALKSDP